MRVEPAPRVGFSAVSDGGGGCVGSGMGYDFVLDAVGVFEEESIIAGRRVFGIFPRRRHNGRADPLDFVMKAIDLRSRIGTKGEVVERAGSAPVNEFVAKGSPRRGEGKAEPLVAIFDYEEVVFVDRGACAALFAEAENWKKPVIKGRGDGHIPHRDLNVVDDRLHGAVRGIGAVSAPLPPPGGWRVSGELVRAKQTARVRCTPSGGLFIRRTGKPAVSLPSGPYPSV